MFKKIMLPVFLLFTNCLLSQSNLQFAGHFVDRDGRVNLVSRFNGKLYEIEVTKDGFFQSGLASMKNNMLEGYFREKKDSVFFSIKYFEDELILKSNGYYLTLVPTHDLENELPTKRASAVRKKEVIVPFPDGQRVFIDTRFAFNLPDDSWEYSDENDYITLKSNTFKGFFKIVPHQISTVAYVKNQFSITALFPGKFEPASAAIDYGKQGIFRTYTGFDAENQKITFHVVTLISLDGGGVHIICGARQNYYKSEQFEIWAKMIANSFEINR